VTQFLRGTALATVAETLDRGESLTISGIGSTAAKTFLLSQLDSLRHPDRVILWCTKSEAEAKQIIALFNFWDGIQPLLPHEDNLTIILSKLIKGQACFILFPLDRLNETVVAPRLFQEEILGLHVGDRLSPADMRKHLIGTGYTENASASQAGEFAVRGNIVDAWSPDAARPLRTEFGTATVESLHRLPSASGKGKGQRLENSELIPFRILTTRQSTNWLRYLARLPKTSRLIISDAETYNDYPQWESIKPVIDRFTQLRFNTLRTSDDELVVETRSPLFYHGQMKKWVADIAKARHRTFLVTSNRGEELKKWWAEHGPAKRALPVTILPATANDLDRLEGFQIDDLKLTVWTDRELFGVQHESGKASAKLDTTFLAELTPGDYIVHLDHGVGRFVGMSNGLVDSIEREYFKLEYDQGDKLLVPSDLAYKLDKYVGASHPQLHRLNSASWKQLTLKVRQDTKTLAKELLRMYALREKSAVEPFGPRTLEEDELAVSFKHDETPDQLRTIEEIEADLQLERPMDRLICGDVGFGKTEVAIRAAFKAVMNGFQVAVLAPTTILVQQHFDTFSERLKQFDVSLASLSRFKTDKEQRETVRRLNAGELDIVIGTHRLLSPDVKFKKLGLIILDEEQRFGVKDKEQLKQMRHAVHVLTMSATPIPRTLNFSLSSLRDLSLITTPPQGRQAIETIIEPYAEDHVRTAITKELKRGGQVYFIHNNVETIDVAGKHLQTIVPKAKISIAHGQMHERDLAMAMEDFDRGRTNVLVVTTIIENGVDLPNVNTLIVENATKFGLAQLYQLRGRIGRSDRQATAYFFYQSKKLSPEAQKRLKALLEAKELGSGFQLALRDLEIRGIGNILGKEQHGQVTAIGLSLYTRLLNQAIEEIKSHGKNKPMHDVTIDLPLDVRIPKDYIANERKRLRVYQELTNITDLTALGEFRDRLKAEYGTLPTNVKNLFEQMEVKILAGKTQLLSIDTITTDNPPVRKLILKVKQFEPEPLKKVLDDNPKWIIGEGTIKIGFEDLGDPWVKGLKKTIRLLRTQLDETPGTDS